MASSRLPLEQAPSGEEVFEEILVGWLLALDVREFLHPAAQAALHDCYTSKNRE